jgi:hypothetical protein
MIGEAFRVPKLSIPLLQKASSHHDVIVTLALRTARRRLTRELLPAIAAAPFRMPAWVVIWTCFVSCRPRIRLMSNSARVLLMSSIGPRTRPPRRSTEGKVRRGKVRDGLADVTTVPTKSLVSEIQLSELEPTKHH